MLPFRVKSMFRSVSKQKAAVWTGKAGTGSRPAPCAGCVGGPATLPLPGDRGLSMGTCGVGEKEREAS